MTWGKISKTDGTRLPLIVHLVDVAECFRALIHSPAQQAILRKLMPDSFDDVAMERLCVICLLHDIGKINSGFQAKANPEISSLKAGHVAEALLLLQRGQPAISAISEAVGFPEMAKWGTGFIPLLRAAIAHHGRPISEDQAVKKLEIWAPHAEHDPLAAAREIGGFLRVNYSLLIQIVALHR